MSVSPSRRRLLQATLLAPAFVACTAKPSRPAPVDPDTAFRMAAVARERELLFLYDAAIKALPARAAVLTALRGEHVMHLEALGRPRSPSASPPAPNQRSSIPPTLAQVVAAERSAAAAHTADALRASAPLAAVLASLAASEASHPVALS